MWSDAKFCALSKPEPNGQTLWVHLITGEQTDIIPGIFKIGEASFCEQLGWPVEGFRKAFAEAFDQGLVKANWSARLVWVPKAIIHNPPQSPNVVRSWRFAWQKLPECDLKVEAWSKLKAFIQGLGEAFGEAFDQACPKPFGMPTTNQEQEQEQDKSKEKIPGDQGLPGIPPGASKKPTNGTAGSHVWDAYSAEFRKRYDVDPTRDATANAICAKLVKSLGESDALKVVIAYLRSDDQFYVRKCHPLGTLMADRQKFLVESRTGKRAASFVGGAPDRDGYLERHEDA